MGRFSVNQIVKGKVAGHFVILGFTFHGLTEYAVVKIVNPKNYSETMYGEIHMPVEALTEVN